MGSIFICPDILGLIHFSQVNQIKNTIRARKIRSGLAISCLERIQLYKKRKPLYKILMCKEFHLVNNNRILASEPKL